MLCNKFLRKALRLLLLLHSFKKKYVKLQSGFQFLVVITFKMFYVLWFS